MKLSQLVLLCLLVLNIGCKENNQKKEETVKQADDTIELEWQQLFNGKDLSDWTPKIAKHETGENYQNTFSVKDGKITVGYDGYDNVFNQQYGHLFYNKPFSAYFLAIEYRFTGNQIADGEGWAWRNSGAMLHCQDPKTMLKDQDFPICIEGQFLGGKMDSKEERTTLNLCTPGTNVVYKDSLFTPHCTVSNSKTYRGDQWVRGTFLVLKDSVIKHIVEGKTVLEYYQPTIGGEGVINFDLEQKQDGQPLTEGYISLQSESHPVEFRKVEIIDLAPIYNNKEKLNATVEAILENEKKITLK
ncbi:3-keto-disaccharide hydrolase [Galbibacter mesophilus]|uniref:3-keto-disaccharide hydrolase n=1 Tax=Galbibacter mesophilus TaxID=379069 RepID=UPI00191DF71C|nr:DUF1080 domain-containing protein [Galbibacter mesophilus]MCM5662070.1 DUF1080 domain-containing protein [Galbibacter mesophilus]